MEEKDILDYLQLGSLVTSIEAEFAQITIGDCHTNIQVLDHFSFGGIQEYAKELRTNAFLELYAMIGQAFGLSCQLVLTKEEPIILDAINECLSKLNVIVSNNKQYVRRSLMSLALKKEYKSALEVLYNNGRLETAKQLERFRSLLFF